MMNIIKYTVTCFITCAAVSVPAATESVKEPEHVRKAFDATVKKLENVTSYRGNYTVNISSMKGAVSQSGTFIHKLPFTFRCREKTSAMGGIMNVEELTVCNGTNGWEVTMAPNGTVVNASRWGLPSMQDIFYAFFNKSQFMLLSHDRTSTFFMLRHDTHFDSVEQKDGDTVFTGKMRSGSQRYTSIYRVAASMGSNGVSNYVPDKVVLRVNKYGIPVELTQYNMKGVPIIQATMNNVKVNTPLDYSLFQYTPSKKVEVLNMDKAMNQEPLHVPHPLLNKKAPALKITYLSGKPAGIKLGTSPVVLTFFASWSKNCRDYLTKIEKLYQEYAGKDVQFITVTDQQELETVKKYQKESRLTLPLYADSSRNTLREYKVKVVPKTLIINKQGIIIDALEGNPPGIEKEIRKSIEKAR
jgi:outer membrane lipoprotein-sorting protein/peroxiredoxin